MNCREFDLWLQEYLDGRSLSLHGDLADHLGHCSTCRELFQAGQLLQQGMEDLPRLTPLPSSLQRIVAEVVSDHRSRRRKRLRLVGAVAAAIALVALPLASWWVNALLSTPSGQTPPLVASNEEPDNKNKPPMDGSLETKMSEATVAVARLTDRLADETKEQARIMWSLAIPTELPPLNAIPQMEDLESPLNPAADSIRETGAGVTTGLQTVATSARRAMDFFVREIPSLPARPRIQ